MKNILLFLISILSHQLSLPLNGQSTFLKSNDLANQINLSSVEMMNFMKLMMEESAIFIDEIRPFINENPEEINVEITVTYDVVQPQNLVPRYWNEYAINSQIARDFFTSSNQYVTDFYELLDDSKWFEKRMEDPFFKKYQSKEFVDQKNISLLNQTSINSWKESNNKFLYDSQIVNDKKLLASIGNWRFNVGPGNGWDY